MKKYGEKFTPDEDSLILPWVHTAFVPYEEFSEIAQQLGRERKQVCNRHRYLRRKLMDIKERVDHDFTGADRLKAHDLKKQYMKFPRNARLYFLRHLLPTGELVEAQRDFKKPIETTGKTQVEQKLIQYKLPDEVTESPSR